MDRRFFSQFVAFAAGLFSFLRFGSASARDEAEDPPTRPSGDSGLAANAVTVEDFIPLAKAKLPKATFDYITTGSEDEVTLHDNVAAFRRLRLLPPLMHGVTTVNLATTVLGQRISLPVILAPVAAQRMFHPQGARAAARAAGKAGTIFVASTSAYNSVEEIAAAAKGPLWFQLYVPRQREVARRLVHRAEQAGYQAILVTVDLGERKDADLRNRFRPPRDMLLKHLRDVGHTNLSDQISYEDLLDFNLKAWELSLSWEFFEWLRGETKLPIFVKGVLSPESALNAVSLGLDGIVVSNHGGRKLDGVPASIDVLRDVAAAVDGRIEILLDSGVRRGGDVLKALTLGATAVLVGRPYAWALAADGEAGVTRVLEIFRDELTNAMIAAGFSSVDRIDDSVIM